MSSLSCTAVSVLSSSAPPPPPLLKERLCVTTQKPAAKESRYYDASTDSYTRVEGNYTKKKNPLHGVVRGRITHLSIWVFTCLPWHIPAAHTIADKNTGSHVMSCLSWENSRHFATPTLASSRNDLKNSTLVMSHYPDLGSASDWSCCNMFQPLRGTTKSWIVTR